MKHRTTTAITLIAVSALAALTGCGGSSGSGSGSSTGGAASGAPVKGGDLVIARTADSQSMNNTTVFDNESIWVFEQIFQTLYTVTPNGKGVQPELATSYKVSADKKTYTFTLRSGVKFSTGQAMTSADVKFSLDQSRAAAKGWGYIDTAIKSVERAHAVHGRGQPQVPVGAAAGRPVAVLQRDRARQLRRQDRDPVLQRPGRHRAVQVGLLAQGQRAQAGARTPTTGNQASRTSTA